MAMLGLVGGCGIDYDRCSSRFSSSVERAVMARLEREERYRRRPLHSDRPRRVRPVSDFGRALARALGMEG